MKTLFTLLTLCLLWPLHAATYTIDGVLTYRSGTRNALPTSVTVDSDTNLYAGSITSTNDLTAGHIFGTFNSTRYDPINLGSTTSFILDPAYSRYQGTASGNFTISLDTNSVTAGVEIEPIYLSIYSASAYTATLDASGTGGTDFTGGNKTFGWGTNVAGVTNIYIAYWDGYVWHFDQSTAVISQTQIAGIVARPTYTPATSFSPTGYNAVVSLTNNITLAAPSSWVTDPTTQGNQFYLLFMQDSTGGYFVTFATNYIWSAASAPTITTNAGKISYVGFIAHPTATNVWLAAEKLNY